MSLWLDFDRASYKKERIYAETRFLRFCGCIYRMPVACWLRYGTKKVHPEEKNRRKAYACCNYV